MNIRKAAASDIDHVIRHRVAMFRDMGYRDQHQLDSMTRAAREYFNRAMPSGAYHAWVAEEEGKVVGGGGIVISDWPGHPLDPQPRRAMILNIYTEPGYRRHGYAKEMVKTIVEWCRQQGFGAVALHASKDARHLYEELGFTPTNEMRLELKH